MQTHTGAASYTHADSKRKRLGKGLNILTIARKLLSEPENWFSVENKDSYHFPGVLPKPSLQQLFYVPDISALNQSCDDAHFIWKDIQLSKGQLNKDRLIKVDIGDKCEEVYFRSAPCLGVKYCSSNDYSHVVPIRDKRNCPKHNLPLQKTTDCPVEFVYIATSQGCYGQKTLVWWTCKVPEVCN